MIKKLEISGVHADVDAKLEKYITKKIGNLDRYIPHKAREAAHATVRIKHNSSKNQKEATCEVVLRLPQETITVSETTMNAFASVDIVETRLKNRIKKYKETHGRRRIGRKIIDLLQ